MAAVWNNSGSTSDWWYNGTTSTTGGNTMYINTGGTTTTASVSNVPTGSTVQFIPYHVTPVTPAQPQVDPRVLNQYLNASDLLEEFIEDLGDLGVTQSDVLAVPIEMFINWLILRSAEEEGKDQDGPVLLPQLREDIVKHRPDRCRTCGRFITKIRREMGIHFCSTEHFDKIHKDISLLEAVL